MLLSEPDRYFIIDRDEDAKAFSCSLVYWSNSKTDFKGAKSKL